MEAVCAAERKAESDASSVRTARDQSKGTRPSWRKRLFGGRRAQAEAAAAAAARRPSQQGSMNGDARHEAKEKGKPRAPPAKKIPVFFIDEAHKL